MSDRPHSEVGWPGPADPAPCRKVRPMRWLGRRLLPLVLTLPLLVGCAGRGDGLLAPSADAAWGLGKNRLAKPPAPPPPGPAAETPAAAQPAAAVAPAPPVALLPLADGGAKPAAPTMPVAALPDTPQDRALALAERARRIGDDLTATALYRQVLADRPDDLEAQLGLAHVLVDGGQAGEARSTAAQLLKQAPNDVRVMALAVRLDLAGGDLAGAAARLATAASLAPDNRDILMVQGIFEDTRGNHVLAERAYRQVLAASPDDLAAANDLAVSLMSAGNPAAAAGVLEPLAADPATTLPAIRHNLAMAYGLLDREDDARRLLAVDMSAAAIDSDVKYYRWLRDRNRPAGDQGSLKPIPPPAPAAAPEPLRSR